MGGGQRIIRRKSMAKGSVENVLTVLRDFLELDTRDYDIHVNFPSGSPVDGPSAGIAVATAVYSALTNTPVLNTVAMTGEISVRGYVRPVGGVVCKVEAARQAGATKVLIPKDNWQKMFAGLPEVEVVPVEGLREVLDHALCRPAQPAPGTGTVLSASSV